MNVPPISDVKDLAILVGFIGTCAVLLWRMKSAEQKLRDLEQTIDELVTRVAGARQIREDLGRRIQRLEDRVDRENQR